MPTIVVDDRGTELSYIDTGAPPASSDYATIFALQGMGFTNHIFEKIMARVHGANLRFVAINRRVYPGSTPLSEAEQTVIVSGTEKSRTKLLKTHGVQVTSFAARFAKQHPLPALSQDGRSGGFAIMGWSLGNATTISAIANIDAAPSDVQSFFASNFRALLINEAPSVALGTELPAKAWSPQIDTSIPEEMRDPLFGQWITSYFDHGDLSNRDVNALAWVLPSTHRAPSIFSMTKEQIARNVWLEPATPSEVPFMTFFGPQCYANYQKACFDEGIRKLLPRMKIEAFTADLTCASSLPSFWQMQADNTKHGGDKIHFKLVHGLNHFGHWDEPDLTLKTYAELLEAHA